ncbi:hypothetical protein CQW23_29789 [Capsicum baccatum]|uniref:Uncharacterized protein n=1 Tax=Capsicum baccatum TaxID=33114 RepID=A0A2G2VCE9_CAPBA|nr:hypothetical protein CQW23_29789 [Capsicum baccatum]
MDFEMAEIKSSELGLQRFRAKCALTYPTRYFSPLEDEEDLVGNSLDHHSTDSYLSSSPQKALPIEDGFSMSHFLLNEHKMFSSFVWMDFGELLGCNDPKHMNQLQRFTFDCLLEYLDAKVSPISDSGFRTCTKLPSSTTKEILIADIIDEVEE